MVQLGKCLSYKLEGLSWDSEHLCTHRQWPAHIYNLSIMGRRDGQAASRELLVNSSSRISELQVQSDHPDSKMKVKS